MQQNILEISNLSYCYEKSQENIFSNFSFSIEQGQIVSLLGQSGAGKTTLLRLISGTETPQSGTIKVHDKIVSCNGKNLVLPEKRNITVMFQEFALFPHLTVAQNISFGLLRKTNKEATKIVNKTLEIVGMLKYSNKYPYELSGGQQQRVSLARAIAPNPKLILMDEPFSHLDVNLRNKLRDETLHIIKDIGCSALIVTHNPQEAMFMSDKILLINNGNVLQQGTPKDLYFNPANQFIAKFFGDVNTISAKIKNKTAITGIGDFKTKLDDKENTKVVIRSEAIKLKKDSNSENIIVAIKNLGMMDLIHIDCVNNVHLHCNIDNMHDFKVGDCVSIDFNKKLVFVY
ncbi:ABC transporter ATP-binding protein [Alphaproteobacteria bacterium]|nr:ABC transporter ATP-binding protein [Alphaproteobacteria bacterium]